MNFKSEFDLVILICEGAFLLMETDEDGIKKVIQYDERYYTPSDITWYLKSLNFAKKE